MKTKIFEPEKEVENICDWIKKYFVENGPDSKAVIGISGGKDSTVAAALLCRALGPERVVGVLMPQGKQEDFNDALKVCDILGIKYYIINIEDICNSLYEKLQNADLATNYAVLTNTPSRIRMSILYAVAANVSGRVANTCNRSEDYVGFSTKYGDLAGDFGVLNHYCVSQILEIGDYLQLPKELVHKTPSDGMCGKTDEDALGFTYKELDDFILYGKTPEYEKYKKIMLANKRNKHKNCINIPGPFPYAESCWQI